MYGHNRLRQIRELSLYLHGGIPETPLPIYETDSQCFSDDRPDDGVESDVPAADSEVLAVATWDPDQGLVIKSAK
jgi:hypothetical protein